MAESSTHRRMKSLIRGELERQSYRVVEEPLRPLRGWISWAAYRPDLLGFRADEGEEQVVIVECETRPNMKRFLSKNYPSLWFQPSLMRKGSIRRILAVPRGRLGGVDMGLRRQWEIWVMADSGPVERVPAMD